MAQTLFWYDLETFGRNPEADRIAQFAGIRTTDDFTPLGDPIVLYCRLSADVLPDPGSVAITGITPQSVNEEGLCEYDFARRIRDEFMVPGTTVVGFNNLRFDDEFIRNLFYRNFFDPYEREWANGNSRWDIIDLARAAHDLRPEGVVWPRNADGRPVFRLEELTAANDIAHTDAHDALSDVRATIALAKLIESKQPKLFRFYFSNRKKEEQRLLLDFEKPAPLVHTAGIYSREEGCTSLVLPVGADPEIRNTIYALDLRYGPSPLIDLPVEEIRRRIFTGKRELEAEADLMRRFGVETADEELVQGEFGGRIPLVTLALNRCPFIAPLSILDKEAAGRLKMDLKVANRHAGLIRKSPELIRKLLSVFAQGQRRAPAKTDPEYQIYTGGFFRDEDKDRFEVIHSTLAKAREERDTGVALAKAKAELYKLPFVDQRIPRMLRRFFARNFPEALGPRETERWKSFCAGRILSPPHPAATDLATYSKILTVKMESTATPAREKVLIKALLDYRSWLEGEVLSHGTPGKPVDADEDTSL